jgi:hypothetical protein
MNVRLAYADTPLTTLDFWGAGTSLDDYEEFECIRLYPPEKAEERNRVTTLTGRIVDHILFRRETVELTISTDELSSYHSVVRSETKMDFIKTFWDAPYKYLYLYDGYYGSNYIAVVTESDSLPVTFADDVLFFPEITFRFINKASYGN